jgi:murein DD-endopeptidase MepM/ murein hydrolase activator NlpD
MSLLTAAPTRVPGLVLVVVLSVVPALVPAPSLGTPGGADPVGVWPLRPSPEVVAGFDPPLDPWGSGHRGVDLLGSAGQPVRAALPGRVTFAGMLAGRGVVVVSHGDTRTTYEPVSADVSVGDAVAAGGRIGRLEAFGSHCFPRACLHWGWLRGETYLDPLDLVGGGPVRLLPLWRDEPLAAPTPVSQRSFSPTYPQWRPALIESLKAVGFFGGGMSDGADSTP